ncbi:hypothetical protein IGI04_015719, partial [Brassica rapa subsp. trilocularis]
VLECHMEFLGTFGCIWSLKDVKQVIIGRAEHGSEVPQRRHEPRATCPKRRTEVARISHPSRSDLPKRHPEVARVSMARRQEAKPGATSQSDPLRSLPKAGATCRGRSASIVGSISIFLKGLLPPVADYLLSFDLLRNTQKLFGEVHLLDFDCYVLVLLLISYLFLYMINLKSNMGLRGIMKIKTFVVKDAKIANRLVSNDCFHIIQPKTFDVEGLEGQEELCFINNNGSWYKKEPNFQYNNYQQKSYPNNQQSGYPPRNNQQSSYQPQQNPLSGSSAPQESSTDTLLKQILESQTRSEKHVGYELKNLHSKIDGSYNELNNKFSHLASTVLECHMEFLGTFGCIWSLKDVKQVIIGRAEHGSEVPQRRHEPRATCPKRRTEVARISHPSRSDLPKRHPEVARVSMARRQEAKPGATSQSDPLRSLPKAGATCRGRSASIVGSISIFLKGLLPPVADYLLSFDLLRNTQKLFGEVHLLDFDCYVLVLLLISYLFLYMINLKSNMGLRGIMKISELSEYLHSRCFDIPQNWFDNLLYYNICLRSLENS